jgi:uncharacterized LabA/DUF88 family protein
LANLIILPECFERALLRSLNALPKAQPNVTFLYRQDRGLIDGANLYATAKSLGFDIDYKRLLKEFQSRGTLLRAFYYTAIIEDQEYSSIRPLIDWLDYNCYTVVTKATKAFIDASGRRKVKGNMDVGTSSSR